MAGMTLEDFRNRIIINGDTSKPLENELMHIELSNEENIILSFRLDYIENLAKYIYSLKESHQKYSIELAKLPFREENIKKYATHTKDLSFERLAQRSKELEKEIQETTNKIHHSQVKIIQVLQDYGSLYRQEVNRGSSSNVAYREFCIRRDLILNRFDITVEL